MIDFTGRQVDHLFVLKKADTRSKKGQIEWDCVCKCGVAVKKTAQALLRPQQQTKSCGCQKWKGHHFNTKYENAKDASYNSLVNRYVQASSRRKIEFKLTKEECIILFNSNCHYCNCTPNNIYNVYSTKGGKATSVNNFRVDDAWITYNGIDRVDSNLSYVLNNVVAACSTCNYAKLAMTTEEFYSWLKKAFEHAKNCGHI